MSTTPSVSVSQERRVVGYLKPVYSGKFVSLLEDTGMGQSEALNEAVKLLLEQNGRIEPPTRRQSKNSY